MSRFSSSDRLIYVNDAVAMTMTHHLCMDIWRAGRPDTIPLEQIQAPASTALRNGCWKKRMNSS